MASKIPSSMRKVVVQKLTSNFREAVTVKTVPVPKATAGSVLVKNRYVGINASDINFSAGKYTKTEPPFDAGFEAVGKIVEVGENVSEKLIGQTVAHMNNGAFSEYQVVPSAHAFPVPNENPQFVPLLVSGMTASLALKHCGDLKPNEKVLVTAAAGGTGQFAVQLAKLAGCHVIGTCSTDKKVEFLKSIGCDHAINVSKENLGKVLKENYPEGIDVVYESVGGPTYETCVNRLAVKGRLIVIGYISGYQSPMGVADSKYARAAAALPVKMLMKSARVHGFFLFHYMGECKHAANELASLLMQNKIKSTVDLGSSTTPGGFVGIDSIVNAVEYLYSRKNVGKIIVDLSNATESKL